MVLDTLYIITFEGSSYVPFPMACLVHTQSCKFSPAAVPPSATAEDLVNNLLLPSPIHLLPLSSLDLNSNASSSRKLLRHTHTPLSYKPASHPTHRSVTGFVAYIDTTFINLFPPWDEAQTQRFINAISLWLIHHYVSSSYCGTQHLLSAS